MNKRMPRLRTDEEAEALLEQDLSEFLTADRLRPLGFEFQPKVRAISLRLSEGLLDAVKERAELEGLSYQRYIRMVLEQALATESR